MKAYRANKGMATFIFNLSTRRQWMINFMYWPLYRQERIPVLTEWEDGLAPKPFCTFFRRRKSLAPAGIQTQNCPACSLYTLLITFSCLNLQICSNNKLQIAQQQNACQSQRISLCTIKSALPQCTTVRWKYLRKWEMKWKTHTGSQTASLRYKWETCHGCGDLYWLWLMINTH